MKMVFEKFESSLEIKRDALNVLRVADPSLYARCALSLAQGFSSLSLEPACFFTDDGKEISSAKLLFFAGDPLLIDLNDKRIVTQAIKIVSERIILEDSVIQRLEALNYEMEDAFEDQFIQMFGNYSFADEWDSGKYLKSLGFCIDESKDRTVFERLMHYLRIMSDLFPDKIISFVNLPTYLTDTQYNEICETAAALQLRVLSYEQKTCSSRKNLENVLYIDENYLEQ